MVIVTIVPGKGSVSVLKHSLLARNSYISLSEIRIKEPLLCLRKSNNVLKPSPPGAFGRISWNNCPF